MEELDALTDAVDEVEDPKDGDSKMKVSPSHLSLSASEEVSGSTAPVSAACLREGSPQGKTEASSPRSSEKKVRFSEELIQAAHKRQTTGSQDFASSESGCLSSFKASSPKKKQEPQQPLESAKQDDGSPQDQGGGPLAPPVAQQQPSQTECLYNTKKDSNPSAAPCSPSPERACDSVQESSVQPVELAKCNISSTNTGMK